MGDLTRALLLPDIQAPDDRLLKTLAVYWDQIVLPDYVERFATEDRSSEFNEVSTAFSELEDGGLLTKFERIVEVPNVDPADLSPVALQSGPSNEVFRRFDAVLRPIVELVERRPELDAVIRAGDLNSDDELRVAGVETIAKALDFAAKHYMDRVRDAFTLSSDQNLAPVARSTVSHLASMTEAVSDSPRAEAALLSTAIEAFEIDPDTPVEEIIRFREKHAGELGRFRASLVDLSEGLREDAKPIRLLAEARDRYRNRVVPALGDLEAALSEGRIRFFVRSLMGATAITLGPVDPTKAVEGGATIMGQTIDYAFSREKLVREHPFGYLHQVSTELSAQGKDPAARLVESAVEDPEERVREMFRGDLGKEFFRDILLSFWHTPGDSPF
jgi:hypothetical protein